MEKKNTPFKINKKVHLILLGRNPTMHPYQ